MNKLASKLMKATVLLFPFVLAACGDGGTADGALDSITIGYQRGNSLHILRSNGYLDEVFEEQGINIEWRELSTGGALIEALNAGSIDFGHAADANAVFAQAAGTDLVYIASALPNPEGLGIVTHEDAAIESVEDLAGERIAIGQGWNSHYLILKAMQEAGMSTEDVNFAWVSDASEGRATFESGDVAALGSWDPFLAALELDIDANVILDGEGYTNNRTYYFASDEVASEHPEVISDILSELNRSETWSNENKDELAELLSNELGLDIEPVQRQVNRKTYGVEEITEDIVAEQQDIANVFFEENLIENEIEVIDMVTLDPEWIPADFE